MKKEEEPDFQFSSYEKHYTDEGFWAKMRTAAKKAGVKAVYGALKLYYAAQSPDTPAWTKTIIFGALGYLILPIDILPDVLPGIGFTDDLAMITVALTLVTASITDEVKEKARRKITDWFGEQDWENIEEDTGVDSERSDSGGMGD